MNFPKIRITKQTFLDIAEIVDAWRVVPRGLLLCVGYFVWVVSGWYMGLPTPTTQHTAFVSVVTAIIPAVIGLYQSSGRRWKDSKEPVVIQAIQPIQPTATPTAPNQSAPMSKEEQENLYHSD